MKLFILLLLAGALTHGRWWTLAPAHNPWAPLDYTQAPNWSTRFKLARLAREPAACQAFMEQVPWQADALPDRSAQDGCGWRDALRVRRMAVPSGAAFTLSCPTAAALALWERHVLQPQAQALLGQPVRRIEHYGSFACRNVYGREGGRRSQHATANALDIAAFVLDDGRRITVLRGWADAEAAPGRFLRAVHAGACPLFGAVLGPAYNRAHADHFHFDRGPARVCR